MGITLSRSAGHKSLTKRIVFVITSLSYAGAQTQVLALASRLKDRGWQPHVVSMMPPEALTDELEAADIPWATLNMRRGAADISALFKLRWLLRDWQPDIVHSHMIHANLLARVSRPLTGTPVLISTAHNVNEGGKARMLAYRLTDFLAEHSTNVSQAAVERYIAIGAAPRDKMSLMPNGIDTERFKPDPAVREKMRTELELTGFTWLAVGRHDTQKDYSTMLNAFARLKNHNSQLIILGEGPLTAELEAQSEALGLTDHVRFLGVRSDIPHVMNAANAYLMSSIYEGLPMVLLEAAATGLPIVTTDVGGNHEVVTPSNGLLAPASDPAALATQMDKLLVLSEQERQQLGQAGRELVIAGYGLEHIVDRWEVLYDDWLRKKGVLLASA